MQDAKNSVAEKRESVEPHTLRKRIGSTDFIVSVHFSQTSTETLEDKILRLMEREAKEIA